MIKKEEEKKVNENIFFKIYNQVDYSSIHKKEVEML